MKKVLIAAAMLLSIAANAQKQHCTATTKAGTPCSRYATEGASYCKQHNPASPHCGATTKAGTPCKALVKEQGKHCKAHS